MRLQALSIIFGCIAFLCVPSASAFSVLEEGELNALHLESDRNLMSQAMKLVSVVDTHSLKQAALSSGYDLGTFNRLLNGDFGALPNKNADYFEATEEISELQDLASATSDYYKSLAMTETKILSSLWSVDGEKTSKAGDLVHSLRVLYCMLAGESGSYESPEDDKSFQCANLNGFSSPYVSDAPHIRKLLDELVENAGQIYLDSRKGYHKQTHALFDFGTCKNSTIGESFATSDLVNISIKPTRSVEMMSLDDAFQYFFATYEIPLREEYSFSGIYDYLLLLESQRMGSDLSDLGGEDNLRLDETVVERQIKKFDKSGDAVSGLTSYAQVQRHFDRLSAALSLAEREASNTLPWRLKGDLKEIFLDKHASQTRETLNGITADFAELEQIMFKIANKPSC